MYPAWQHPPAFRNSDYYVNTNYPITLTSSHTLIKGRSIELEISQCFSGIVRIFPSERHRCPSASNGGSWAFISSTIPSPYSSVRALRSNPLRVRRAVIILSLNLLSTVSSSVTPKSTPADAIYLLISEGLYIL